jgi:hypothetical protein
LAATEAFLQTLPKQEAHVPINGAVN